MLVPRVANVPLTEEAVTGLDWNGNPSGRRAVIYSNPHTHGLPFQPATYLWKVFQRNQVSGVGDGTRYYTTFFWGNNGIFVWGSGYERSYYGCHPFPDPAPAGDGKWEIACDANDFFNRDDSSSPYVTNGRWYSQALVVTDLGSNQTRFKFYIDLPSVTTANVITRDSLVAGSQVNPPSPCLIFGQGPDNGSGQSWGGYSRWEEQNAILRGVRVFNADLSEANVLQFEGLDTNATVLAKRAALGISAATLWYLNMNWTLSDVNDKSGNGHHMSLVSTNGAAPTLYTV